MANVMVGLRWAVKNGADVVLMCFGSDTASPLFAGEIQAAHESNVVLVASAGNGESSDIRFPAGLHGVTSVAAVDAYDIRAQFSNFGTYVDYAAPGVGIRSTYPGGAYASWSGTSMAAPFVAGPGTRPSRANWARASSTSRSRCTWPPGFGRAGAARTGGDQPA
jgi:subtilisin family serine protease